MLFVFDDLFLVLISHCWRPFLYSTFVVVLVTIAMPKHGHRCKPQCKEPDLSFHTFASDSEMKILF